MDELGNICLTDKMHQDYPDAINKLSKGHAYDMASNIFTTLPEIFYDSLPTNNAEYVRILGREKSKNVRVYKYIKREYLTDVENMYAYKVYIAQANGNGTFGERLSQPIIEGPGVGSTETFLSIGNFETKLEAENLGKYIKTKFARALLGVLKVTQNGNKPVWKMIPLQDFTPASDIDWNVTITNIDRQLYKKYGLTQEEIDFIETNVKEMS